MAGEDNSGEGTPRVAQASVNTDVPSTDAAQISDEAAEAAAGGHVFWTRINVIEGTGAYKATHDENGKLLPRYDAPPHVKEALDTVVNKVTGLFK